MQDIITTAPAQQIAPVADIQAQLARYAELSRGAYSENTLRAIRADTRVFQEWCAGAGMPYGPPASPETVAAFVDAMGETRKPATVSRYISSIDHLHRAVDMAPPGATNAVRLALRRLRRAKGTRQKQAKPLRWRTLSIALARIGDDLNDPKTKQIDRVILLRDAAMMALAYDTFARASELVAFNVSDISQDVGDGASAFIASSKTDQEGEGDHRFVSASTYFRVMKWVKAARLERGDPLFIPLGFASTNDRLAAGDVSHIFARRCGDLYSAHSTRVGASQDAIAAGATTAQIQQAGGWKSERMVLRYGGQLKARESAAALLAKAQGR